MNPVLSHTKNLIASKLRLDGRKHDEFREVMIEKGLVHSAEGSSRVKFGDTEVIAGVKLSIGTPFPDTPDKGALMVNTEFLPMANANFESGPPSIDSIEVSRVVDRSIREGDCINMSDLMIEHGEKVWIISIDVTPINAAGNLFDISCLAAMAALQDALFPEVKDGKVDYNNQTDEGLKIDNTPILVTVHKIGNELLVDPTCEEEEVSEARLSVTVINDDRICSLQKGGDLGFTSEEVDKILTLAIAKSKELRGHLEAKNE
jgi:exosome complex component RRP42